MHNASDLRQSHFGKLTLDYEVSGGLEVELRVFDIGKSGRGPNRGLPGCPRLLAYSYLFGEQIRWLIAARANMLSWLKLETSNPGRQLLDDS
jgi:hypothetical protein